MVRNRIEDRVPPRTMRSIRFNRAEQGSLRQLAVSSRVADRKQCVKYLWTGREHPANRPLVLQWINQLIPDRSREVRWAVFHLLGSYAEPSPEEIWPMIVAWGSVKNRGIRAGIACFVLEHVLEHHFAMFFPQVRTSITEGNRLFAYTLACCDKLGQAAQPRNASAFDALVRSLQTSHPEVALCFASPHRSQENKWLKEARLVEQLLSMPAELQVLLENVSQRIGSR